MLFFTRKRKDVTRKDAQKGWDSLRSYLEFNCEDPEAQSVIDKMDDMFASLRIKDAIQTKFTDFMNC